MLKESIRSGSITEANSEAICLQNGYDILLELLENTPDALNIQAYKIQKEALKLLTFINNEVK
jgi:hypothetical protein